MEYHQWREDLFGRPSTADPVEIGLSEETESLSEDETLSHISCVLRDPEIRHRYTIEQLGFGLSKIFDISCSDIPLCYVQESQNIKNEGKKVEAIADLRLLYVNFFAPICRTPVQCIGNDPFKSRVDYLCYMFWDIFVLYPDNATQRLADAAVGVMSSALELGNENCLVSALHGLGHWVSGSRVALQTLTTWLSHPTTTNLAIRAYAEQAKIGNIV